jgi:alanyl-tRNA synthetase
MQFRTGSEIRTMFLKFFETKGHKIVHSSSLVPHNDPTLLFTNAGMNQFKDVFLGLEQREYTRATTSQKCVRAGGKHNDLENVGFTRRHHTFFEMLGNFSFGDYFKREAIAYAWELVTSEEWFGIPKDKLYVTIFKGEGAVPRDAEAYGYWLEQGVPAERIFEMGMKDNFWQMGDTGPCGPCSEIFYDLGIEASETGEDKPFGEDDQRYVEIWNLVFMQFDRSASGELALLPKPSIDTGAGLERVASVLQGKLSNYETDLFTPLIARAAELTNSTYGDGTTPGDASLRIIADHARAATFLINDGVLPANEGRGYVLRKILRRGIRHGRLLGQQQPFMFQMVYAVRDEMQIAYPELTDHADLISKVVNAEERQFARVLERGSRELEETILEAKRAYIAMQPSEPHLDISSGLNEKVGSDVGWSAEAIESTYTSFRSDKGRGRANLSGQKAFYLYETFGLPFDFMVDAARDADIDFDLTGFEEARAEEQARARASWKGGSKASASPVYRDLPKTAFDGYTSLEDQAATVLAIVKDNVGVESAQPGDEVEIVLDHTTFYADSGGQVGDHGWLYSDDHNTIVAEVHGCTKPVQGIFAHKCTVRQLINVGQRVDAVVDQQYRDATKRNHTGTHLIHAALREVLGTHVKQAGSLVSPSRLRFDFSHFAQVADEELQDIEDRINKQVLANTTVQTMVDVPIDVAVNEYHAMALFGEKYGDKVRVVKIGDYSTELCGGTHTSATGEIGLIKLTGESSVASGVRRIEAVTGLGALSEFRRDYDVAQVASQLTGIPETTPDALRHKLSAQEEELKKLRRELDQARMKSAASSVSSAGDNAVDVGGIKVLAQRVEALDRGQMRTLVDNLRNKLGSGVVALGAATEDGKVALIVGVTKDLLPKLSAGKIVNLLAQKVGGAGGGRADLAEAGGKDPAQLDAALAGTPDVVRSMLS